MTTITPEAAQRACDMDPAEVLRELDLYYPNLEAATLIRQMQAAMVEADRRRLNRASYAEAFACDAVDHCCEPLAPFLPKVDPLVEAIGDMLASPGALSNGQAAHYLRAALSRRGLEVRQVGEDGA